MGTSYSKDNFHRRNRTLFYNCSSILPQLCTSNTSPSPFTPIIAWQGRHWVSIKRLPKYKYCRDYCGFVFDILAIWADILEVDQLAVFPVG